MVTPSCRRELAHKAVIDKGVSIRLSCDLFSISETCYRYQPKLRDENTMIADWLMRLARNQRNWGFGLCFLYLRNVKGTHGIISAFIESIENWGLICVEDGRSYRLFNVLDDFNREGLAIEMIG